MDPNVRIADYTFWLTVFSAALSFVGALEFIWIVRQERWMKRSVEAARDSVKATREVGKAQVRAYLTCEGATFAVEDYWMVCRPRIKNYGQSPAINVRVSASVSSILVKTEPQVPQTREPQESKECSTGCAPIPAGQEGDALLLWSHADLNGQIERLKQNDEFFWLVCALEWQDVFDGEHSHIFTLSPHQLQLGLTGGEILRSGDLTASNQDPVRSGRTSRQEE